MVSKSNKDLAIGMQRILAIAEMSRSKQGRDGYATIVEICEEFLEGLPTVYDTLTPDQKTALGVVQLLSPNRSKKSEPNQ